MAHEDFENIVKSRFQGFESAPPESVWSGVNAIRAQRRKRVFWWLLPILLITIGASAFYATNSYPEPDSNNKKSLILTTGETLQNNDKEIVKEKTLEITTDKIDSYSNTRQSYQYSPKSNGESSKKAPEQTPSNVEKNSTTSNPKKKNSDEIDLIAMEPYPIRFPILQWELQRSWLDGITSQRNKFWSKRIGLQLGSFISISEARADYVQSMTIFAESSSHGNATYNRFVEAAPFIEWTSDLTGFSIRGNILYSAANLSATTNADTFLGRQQSYGLGIGSGYGFVRHRFEAYMYVQIQSEVLSTRYSNTDSYNWFVADNQGGGALAQTNVNAPAPPSYSQLALSGEVGIRCNYALSNPKWRLNLEAGYRNYFWQQKVDMLTNQAILDLPQLVHLNLGASYQF